MKDTTKAFLKGLAIGVGSMLLLLGVCTMLAKFVASLDFGPTIFYDEAARQSILEQKIPLTAECTELFYYCFGISHEDTYIAFSGSQHDLDAIVMQLTRKKLSALSQWSSSDHGNAAPLLDKPGGEFHRMYFNLSRVKHGLYVHSNESRGLISLIYDRDNGRVYYHARD